MISWRDSLMKNNSLIFPKNSVIDIQKIEELSKPLSFYGGRDFESLKISYISDIHLLHHINSDLSLEKRNIANINGYMNKTIKQLYNNSNFGSIIVFLGDVCSDSELNIQFYKNFINYDKYFIYKSKRYQLEQKRQYKMNCLQAEKNVKILENQLYKFIKQNLYQGEFEDIVKYKKKEWNHLSWIENIKHYKKRKKYKTQNYNEKHNIILDYLAFKLDRLEQEKKIVENYKTSLVNLAEKRFNKDFLKITLSEVYNYSYSYVFLNNKNTAPFLIPNSKLNNKSIFVILGNHEYIEFNDIQDAVFYYKKNLEAFGIKVLQNEFIEYGKYVIYGGTGFAKYNQLYNANNICCCKKFTRENELIEGENFEKGYYEAKQRAKKNKNCFVCFSHYPVNNCLSKVDNDTIYLYGHNHQNYFCKNEYEVIYADNQIGYKKPIIGFKTMSTGYETNPYFSLKDGLYVTTVKKYLQFNRYIGEYIEGDGKLLHSKIEKYEAEIYVIKENGYYGFFLINKSEVSAKGISILVGGNIKKITKSIDIHFIYNNFGIILNKYLSAMFPYRKIETLISEELREVGFNCIIHGSIIDLDYYNHIMINPFDSKITLYYSSFFGSIKEFNSFNEMLNYEKNRKCFNYIDFKKLENKIHSNISSLRLIGNSSYLISSSSNEVLNNIKISNGENKVETSGGMYSFSRNIKQLDRLFTGHLLRKFDLSLIDASDKMLKE